jgi:hypothetical protein
LLGLVGLIGLANLFRKPKEVTYEVDLNDASQSESRSESRF